MKIKKSLSGALYFILFFSTLFFKETDNTFVVYSLCLITLIAVEFKPNPINPYFYIAPALLYLAANFLYVFMTGTDGHAKFFSCAFLGMFFFSIIIKREIGNQVTDLQYKTIETALFVRLFFGSLFLLSAISIAAKIGLFPQLIMAIHLSLSSVASAVLIGALLAISNKRPLLALSLSVFYLAHIFIKNILAEDPSRLSFFDFIVVVFLITYYRKKKTNKLGFRSKVTGVFSAVVTVIAATAILLTEDIGTIGGDALIIQNAIGVISASVTRHEYFMPFFNGGFVLVPDYFWPIAKPTAYNSSAWFIENVLNIDPRSYPWGAGVSLFSAGYLYAGFTGVALLFSMIGFFTKILLRNATNTFWIGFACYFLMRIPLAFFRMDETFIFGSVGPMIISMIIFIRLYKRRIDFCFKKANSTDLSQSARIRSETVV